MLIRQAGPDDCAQATDVWRETAVWLEQGGQPLWSASDFTLDRTAALAERGELIVALDQGVVACMTLQDADEIFWPEPPSLRALYLHKLAVRRARAGRGLSAAMIEWACEFALERGVEALRLDCAPRPPLVELYQRHGFQAFDKAVVVRGGYEAVRLERRL